MILFRGGRQPFQAMCTGSSRREIREVPFFALSENDITAINKWYLPDTSLLELCITFYSLF